MFMIPQTPQTKFKLQFIYDYCHAIFHRKLALCDDFKTSLFRFAMGHKVSHKSLDFRHFFQRLNVAQCCCLDSGTPENLIAQNRERSLKQQSNYIKWHGITNNLT